MSRRLKTSLTFCSVFILAVGLIAGLYLLASHYLAASDVKALPVTVDCKTTGVSRLVTISHDQVSPKHTTAKLCDRLTILNKDNTIRLMAFGSHEHHLAYDGITEKVIGQDDSFTVILNQPGNFQFHDHIHAWVKGSFTVTN